MAFQVKDGNGSLKNVPFGGLDPTYHASAYNQTAVASSTDVVQMVGIAGTVGRLFHVGVNFTPGIATAAGQQVSLFRRSTAGTTATVAPVTTVAKSDINAAAAAIVVNQLTTAAQTAGTAAGTIRSTSMEATAAIVAPDRVVWDFGTRGEMPPLLQGAADFITIGFAGVTPGAGFSWEIVWSESTV